MTPFLSIVTRCCRRPQGMRTAIGSVLMQTCRDWEQIFLVDPGGIHDTDSIQWANKQFRRYAHHVKGKYVFPLDDDGILVNPSYVERAKELVGDSSTQVVLQKITTFDKTGVFHVWPSEETWDLDWEDGERPKRWAGNGYNVMTRRDVWCEHLTHYETAPGGDWHYITSLLERNLSFKKLDMVVARSTMRGGGVLFEKCAPDWFDDLAREFGLIKLNKNVWRLTP